jgi:hypothetical protein
MRMTRTLRFLLPILMTWNGTMRPLTRPMTRRAVQKWGKSVVGDFGWLD